MHETTQNVLLEVASFLDDVSGHETPPDAACAGLAMLRERHADTSIELVWEDQAFDGSYHYDALIHPPSGGTVSLSVCRAGALPWALRGLQRWRESDLLSVNGTVLSVGSAIAQLELLWEQGPLMRRLIDSCIVESELRRRAIEVTPREVQCALDGVRRGRGLRSAADMRAWMQDSGTTMQHLEDLATRLARALKLREILIGDAAVDECLARHPEQFDTLRVAVARVDGAAQAHRIATQAAASPQSFLQLVQETFVNDAANRTQLSFREDLRYRLIAELGAQPEAAATLWGPVAGPAGFTLMSVLSQRAALHDDSARHAARAKLFDEWSTTQRRAARVDWFWGDARRTGEYAAA